MIIQDDVTLTIQPTFISKPSQGGFISVLRRSITPILSIGSKEDAEIVDQKVESCKFVYKHLQFKSAPPGVCEIWLFAAL